MLDFAIAAGQPKAALYAELTDVAQALVAGENDAIANMANISALIWHHVPDLNWAGFYRMIGDELVLGPFQGKTACIRIPLGKGVCGTAAMTGEVQCVADVHSFAGHIACDADSRSELVIPVTREGKVIAVLDLDSPLPGRFDSEDVEGMDRMVSAVADSI